MRFWRCTTLPLKGPRLTSSTEGAKIPEKEGEGEVEEAAVDSGVVPEGEELAVEVSDPMVRIGLAVAEVVQ